MSDQPQYNENDSGLDKLRYKNFFENSEPCEDSTEPEVLEVDKVWWCVFNPLEDTFECQQTSILNTFGTDIEVYSTQEECQRKSKCAQKFYCVQNIDEEFVCSERQVAVAPSGKTGYDTLEECENNCSDIKYYCMIDTARIRTGLSLDPCFCTTAQAGYPPSGSVSTHDTAEDCATYCTDKKWVCAYFPPDNTGLNIISGFKCVQKQAGIIYAEYGPEVNVFNTKEECEQFGDCQEQWFCMPSGNGYSCKFMTRGEALDPITGNPSAIGYSTQEECENNCPFPTSSETPSPSATPSPTPTRTPTPTPSSTETPTESP